MMQSQDEAAKWNERYAENGFAYGETPNLFFKEWLAPFTPGRILMPADGEGRNGVFAAREGWQVTSFDLSEAGREKALQLARQYAVEIDYRVGDATALDFEKEGFDAIGLIYAHFAADKKVASHQRLHEWLKPGGVVVFEAFSKSHLPYVTAHPGIGGPGDIDVLYSKEELLEGFPGYEVLLLEEVAIELQEGKYHNGTGAVIRFVARKPVE